MNDSLARNYRKPLFPSRIAGSSSGATEYVAFATKDHVTRLKIKSAGQTTRSPRYDYLLDISYDGTHGTNFALIYSFMVVVVVSGRNLHPIITALEMGTADYIQEFDSERFQKPSDPSAPVIDSIEIISQQGGPKLPEGKKPGPVH
jgi:hypothetical protein